jgi:hypothetical protein
MTQTPWWVTSVAVIGATATILAAGLVWMLLTRPIAVAQAFALGQ